MASQPVPDTADDKPATGKAASYVPDGYKTVDEYLTEMREDYRLDVEADKDNREAAIDDLKFASGDQWDAAVKAFRQPVGGPSLPCLTINTIPQFIGQLIGDRRANETAIKVLPKEDGDKEVASIRSDLVRNIEIESRAKRVYDAAFEDMVTCGIGNFEVCTEYASDDVFDQNIVLKQIANPLAVVWDRMSVDPTGRDAEHCFVDDTMPRREFERKYPDAKPSDLHTELAADLSAEGWCSEDVVRVTAHWRIITRPRKLALLTNGSIHDITEQPIDAQFIALDDKGRPRIRTVQRKYAQRHLVTGHAMLEGPYEMAVNRLPVIRMNGREVRVGDKRVRFGLVRFAKDPVRLKNFWRSKRAERLGYASNAKWLVSDKAIQGREAQWNNDHIDHVRVLTYKEGANEPKQIDPPANDIATLQEAELNQQDIKDVTGIHDASLGIKSNETSGKAILARQREGDVAGVVYHDNANEAIMEGGDVINQLIGTIYDSTRTIRIVGEDGEPKLQKINDPMDPESLDLAKGKYDVTISTGASYTTRRVEAQEGMLSFLQAAPVAAERVADLVAGAQDWPNADKFAERLKPPGLEDEEGEGPQIPLEVQAQMQQMEQMLQEVGQAAQQLQAENEQLQADRSADAAKAASDERKDAIAAYKAETERMKVTGQLMVDAIDAANPEIEPDEGQHISAGDQPD